MSKEEINTVENTGSPELILENEFIKVELDGETISWDAKNGEDVDSPLFTTVIQELVALHQENKHLQNRPRYNLGSVHGREQMVIDNLKARGVKVTA
ncbi:hypothetical protein LMH73_006220 [Vibrio splendidus]|nr:hypothetical protein [Vibrio splendidus]MCC4880748.1 hypothetical protein [Vibrio splendidus]